MLAALPCAREIQQDPDRIAAPVSCGRPEDRPVADREPDEKQRGQRDRIRSQDTHTRQHQCLQHRQPRHQQQVVHGEEATGPAQAGAVSPPAVDEAIDEDEVPGSRHLRGQRGPDQVVPAKQPVEKPQGGRVNS